MVDKYRIMATLMPMLLLEVYILYGAIMQPLMILEYFFGLVDRNLPGSKVLPRLLYINGKPTATFQLSGNTLYFHLLAGS